MHNDYKGSDVASRLKSLSVNLPRFIWRVMMRVDDKLQFDFLFDATGIAQHNLLVHAHMMPGTIAQGYQKFFGKIRNNVKEPKLPTQAKAILDYFHRDTPV